MKKEIEKARKKVKDSREILSEVVFKMRNIFDSRSEEWKESDSGFDYEDKIDILHDVVDELDSIIEAMEEI